MEEDDLALDKAIESGDTDLVYFVLLQMKNKLPLATFFHMLSSRPLALALVESSAASNDSSLLKDLYYQDDRPIDSSNLLLRDALDQSSSSRAAEKLKIAHRLLTESKDPAGKEHQKSIDEAQQLLKVREALKRDLAESYSSLSLHATIYQLILNGYIKRAQKLQSDFHVSEKEYSWIRLRALVTARNWGELEELSRSRKSTIGWEPYYNEVLGAGNTKVAASFISKCAGQTPQQRSEMYVKCGLLVDAGKELAKAKDVAGLEALRENTNDRGAQLDIERMLGSLRGKK